MSPQCSWCNTQFQTRLTRTQHLPFYLFFPFIFNCTCFFDCNCIQHVFCGMHKKTQIEKKTSQGSLLYWDLWLLSNLWLWVSLAMIKKHNKKDVFKEGISCVHDYEKIVPKRNGTAHNNKKDISYERIKNALSMQDFIIILNFK